MINETYNSFKEAEERAKTLLWNDRPQGATEVSISSKTSPAWDEYPKKPHFITMEGSEAYALILVSEYTNCKGRKFENAYLTYVGANDKPTYPFRNIQKFNFPLLVMAMLSRIPTYIKPTEPITAKEAATAAGEEKIRHFFGVGYEDFKGQGYLLEAIRRGEIEAFTDEGDEEPDLSAEDIIPAALSEAVGKPVRNLKEYIAATEALMGRSLNDKEREALEFPYYYWQIELYGLYCLYCFLLTEKYTDLKQAEKEYNKFGLPKGWQKLRVNYGAEILDDGESVEEAVLNRYFDTQSFRFICPINLREIADYTGAPIKLIYEVMGESQEARRLRRRYKHIEEL